MKKPSLYLVNVVLTMLILPVASIILVAVVLETSRFNWNLIGKWFVFWAIGVRLFIAGLRQIIKPGFTAQEIFHISNSESFVIVKELGYSNLCIGLMGIFSLFIPLATPVVAIGGGLYFGLAGIQHVIKKPVSANETIALVSDFWIFGVMIAYLSAVLIRY